MKHILVALVAVFLLIAASGTAHARASHTWGAGMRRHSEQPDTKNIPYGDGNVSYGLAYEFHEESGFWQLAVNYSQDVGADDAEEHDYAVTPQINLIVKDRSFRAGVGALATYTSGNDDTLDSDWSDIYWQFILGYELPFGDRVSLSAYAYYPFESWGDLGKDFDWDHFEFGGWLTLQF